MQKNKLINSHLVPFKGLVIVCFSLIVSASIYAKNMETKDMDSKDDMAKIATDQLSTDKQAVRQVILAMNQAVTQGDLEAVMQTFAEHAIKVDLFPAHYKVPTVGQKNIASAPPALFPRTANLRSRWQAVFGIMSASSKLYERKVNNVQVQLDGAMATAWVHIQTRTVRRDSQQLQSTNQFYEMLLLKKIAGQWKIMLSSNNRHDR